MRSIQCAARLCFAILLLLAYQSRAAATENKQPLIVGLLAPLTGVMAPHGESMRMGAQVAAEVLNTRGGVLGQPVQLVTLDTQSDPAVASQRAQELIQRYGARLLLGTGLSSETLAVIPVVTRAKLPFIYSMDGELKTCRPGHPDEVSPYVFGAGFTEHMVVPPFLARLAQPYLKQKPVKVYFLGGDYVYPRVTNAFARKVAESIGFDVVGDEYTDVSTSDYTPTIRRIIRSGATVLMVTNPGSAAATFMLQARQFGLDRRMVITGFATFAQEAVGEMGQASENVVYANRYTDQLTNPANEKFVAAFRKMFPDRPLLPGPTAAAGAYGALLVAAQAIEKAGSLDPGAFAKSMEGLNADLPQGPIVVDAKNHIFDQHLYLLRVAGQRYRVLDDLGLQLHPGLEDCSVR